MLPAVAYSDQTQADILIIGAGLCGLSTARHLIDGAARQGIAPPKIVILEASETPGGRVKTALKENGVTVNTGAHWFHGGESNPFYRWVKNRYPEMTFREDTVRHVRGIFNNASVGPEFRERNGAALESAYASFSRENPDRDLSLAALAEKVGTQEARDYARFMAQLWAAADDPAEVSAREFFTDPFGPGGMQLAGGNGRLIERIVAELRTDGVTIVTGTPAQSVDQTGDFAVARSRNGQQWQAQQVVSTVSIGVLKSETITFHPAHPPELAAFLDAAKMGHMAKISLPMQSAFFAAGNIAPDTHIDIFKPEGLVFCHAHSGGEPVISVLTGGALARKTESMTQEEIFTFLDRTIGQVPGFETYRQFLAGAPKATGWGKDAFVGGAYATLPAGNGDRPGPVRNGRLVITGEAFVNNPEVGAATMAAAWYAGEQAAAMILEAYKARPQTQPCAIPEFL